VAEHRGVDVLKAGLGRDAMIGNEDVNGSERRLDILNQLFDSTRICHVGSELPRYPAYGDDLCCERIGRLSIAAVGDGDRCDTTGEPAGSWLAVSGHSGGWIRRGYVFVLGRRCQIGHDRRSPLASHHAVERLIVDGVALLSRHEWGRKKAPAAAGFGGEFQAQRIPRWATDRVSRVLT
jgi:hypothetical protein